MRTHLYVTPLVVVLCLCGAREAAAQGPEAIGEWGPLQASPVVAVHSSLLPSGKVLLWPQLDSLGHNGTEAYLWDPLVNSFQSAVNNSTELYCSGHASLADGRLLSIGGEVGFATGLRSTNIFDPASETWSQRALMNFGRWYPTATTLADGRVLATSGLIDLGNEASTPELYDVGRDDWTPLPAADQSLPLYPFMFVLPDAQIFYAGPGIVTRTLDLNTETWTEVGDSNVLGDSAAMYLPGKVLKSGGGDPPLDGADVIDMTEVSPEWRAVGPMAFARRSHNLVLLPDGKVLAVGGNSATRFFDDDPNDSVLEAELWDPSTGTWQTMAPIGDPRMYHSTAVLLPDGRVFVAGGNDFPTYQSYSPPYLFQGARPSLTAAPGSVLYGLTFAVETPDAASIASVSLMRLSSVTHGFDQNQRYVPLDDFTLASDGLGLEIMAPSDANVAPPGVYMLFLVNNAGVPSAAEFVRLSHFSGQEFILSKNADFSTDDRTFFDNETLYMLVFSDVVDFSDIKKTEWELKSGDRVKSQLTNHFDGTYTDAYALANLPNSNTTWSWKGKIEDQSRTKFQPTATITVLAAPACSVDADCDDGLFCNGTESCDPVSGCQVGTPLDCSDAVSCTFDSCNESTDSCDHVPDDALCDNGLVCDGAEICDASLDCQPGTPLVCDDGSLCTTDSCDDVSGCVFDPIDCGDGDACTSDSCDPGTGSCSHAPLSCDDVSVCTSDSCNPASGCVNAPIDCSDGTFCNGLETCDPASGCQAAADVDCDDGVGCTVDSCNEASASCDHVPDHAACDDSLFCNGAETCDATADCQTGSDPCSGQSCDEGTDQCVGVSEVVAITLAEWKSAKLELKVRATSSEQPGAVLTVIGFGQMRFKDDKNYYEFKTKPVANPGTVTVTSSLGGSDTATVKSK